MLKIIDGRKIADNIIKKCRKIVQNNKLKLNLSVILVGNNPASLSYIAQKEESAKKAGVNFFVYRFPKNIRKEKLEQEIKKIIKISSGVIIQLPLHPALEKHTQSFLNLVPEEKDVDVLSEKRSGKFYTGDFFVLPPVVGAVSYILKGKKISLKGKNIAVVGSGKLVGKPLTVWLMFQKATVSIINKTTKNASFFTKKAEIIISGTGESGLIKGNMVRKGVIAIDAGSSFEKKGMKGDFSKKACDKSLFFSPVPGGVGPITSACLIENLVKLNLKK